MSLQFYRTVFKWVAVNREKITRGEKDGKFRYFHQVLISVKTSKWGYVLTCSSHLCHPDGSRTVPIICRISAGRLAASDNRDRGPPVSHSATVGQSRRVSWVLRATPWVLPPAVAPVQNKIVFKPTRITGQSSRGHRDIGRTLPAPNNPCNEDFVV